MELANLTLILAQRSGKASNLNIESLSVDKTSTVRFLYSSLKKSFTIVSLTAKSKSKAPKKGTETRPVDFLQKNFAKSSFSVFPSLCLEEFSCLVQIDVLFYRAIYYHLCSKTLQRNQTVLWRFGSF